MDYEYLGRQFHFIDGKWFDSDENPVTTNSFIIDLNKKYITDDYFKNLSENELDRLYLATKDTEIDFCHKLCIHAVNRRDITLKKKYLPRFVAVSRKKGKAQYAIDTAIKLIDKYGHEIASVPLFTSMAGAYSDLKNFYMADKYNKLAIEANDGISNEYIDNVNEKVSLGKKGLLS